MNIFKRAYQSFVRGPIFVILFGLIFFGIGGGLTLQQYVFRQDALQAPGVVTGHQQSCDDEGCTYHSVVNFVTQDGRSVSYTSTFSSSPPAHDVGENVTMFYDPMDPTEAVIKGEGGIFRVIFMIIGGIIMLFGLVFFAANIRSSYLEEG